MIVKKHSRLQLENYRTPLLFLSLCSALFLVYIVIEYKSFKSEPFELVLIDKLPVNEITFESMVSYKKIPKKVAIHAPVERQEVIKKEVDKTKFTIIDDLETDVFINKDKPVDITIDDDITKLIDNLNVAEDPIDLVADTFNFNAVTNVAIFPGCEKKKDQKKCFSKKVNEIIKKNFDAEIAAKIGLNGVIKIYTQFMVDTNGNVSKIAIRTPYTELEDEARRAINKIPHMKPAMQNGKAVNLLFSLPILFKVE